MEPPVGRDELSGSIFRQNFLLVTSPDSDGTVLPFDRGPAKLLTASMQSLKLLPFDPLVLSSAGGRS
jgi:hypothetical protein